MKTVRPDICVIGGGSGGLSVAAAAAAFGVSVTLVERGRMGGDCLNYGCVPSKAMIAAARHAHDMRHADRFGIASVEPAIDGSAVRAHVNSVIAAIAPNDSVERFTGLGVDVIEAEGAFMDADTLMAGDVAIKARRFVIATGSTAAIPPIPGLGTIDYLTNETIFQLGALPEHLMIIGGGPIGMELAQAHRRLGSRVTVVEGSEPLQREDRELAGAAIDHLRSEGIDIRSRQSVEAVRAGGDGTIVMSVRPQDGPAREITGSHLLVAAGRKANLERLQLDKAGIIAENGQLKLSKDLRTSNRRVYAIGDVAGLGQFTHLANHHAGLVVRAILFRLPVRSDRAVIPRATFIDPPLVQVGPTEAEARRDHGNVQVLTWNFSENDKAQAERQTAGRIKLVADRRGRLLGVSILGADAPEMANFWSLALSRNMKLRDIAGYVSPYPTLGEIGKRAAVSYFAPMARKPFVRTIVRLLQRLG